jgi:4-amino-4-deoxy-L-arabinose transferase-like glycosyltransferase
MGKNKTNQKPKQPAAKVLTPLNPNLPLVLLALGMVIVLYIRIRLLGTPLERDEGGFAYIASEVLKGHLPFTTALDSKPPCLYFFFAIFIGLFGKTSIAFHSALLVSTVLSMMFIYLAGQKMQNRWMGVAAAILFGLLSVSSNVLGFAAHATHIAVLFMTGSVYLLSVAFSNGKKLYYFLGGLLAGLSFLMKQPAIYFLPMGFLLITAWFIYQKAIKKSLIPLLLYTLASVLPFVIIVMIYKFTGNYEIFYKMVFGVTATYANKLSFSFGMEGLAKDFPDIIKNEGIIWILALVGIVVSFFYKNKFLAIQLILLACFGFLATTPGFYFRPHYFVIMLPAVAWAAGSFIASAMEYLNRKLNATAANLTFIFYSLFLLHIISARIKNTILSRNLYR